MIQAFHDHADHRDDFEMIAIHDSSVKSIEEMDERIESARKQYWKGQDLPFPVLIDKEKRTEETFGISGHPTHVIIDPDGNVVGESSLAAFEKELPPLPAALQWARHRDLQKNIHWTWDEDTNLKQILRSIKMFTQLECAIDPMLTKEFGLTEESELAVYVNGYGVTLRSIEQLMFESYNAELAPSADGKSLVLGKKSSQSEAPLSHFQTLHNQKLTKRITSPPTATDKSRVDNIGESGEKEAGTAKGIAAKAMSAIADAFGNQSKVQPLELNDVELREAVKRIATHFDLPMGINSAALKKADQKVTGEIEDERLELTLNQMLEPIGLMVIVKYELVLVVPIED